MIARIHREIADTLSWRWSRYGVVCLSFLFGLALSWWIWHPSEPWLEFRYVWGDHVPRAGHFAVGAAYTLNAVCGDGTEQPPRLQVRTEVTDDREKIVHYAVIPSGGSVLQPGDHVVKNNIPLEPRDTNPTGWRVSFVAICREFDGTFRPPVQSPIELVRTVPLSKRSREVPTMLP